MNNTTQKYTVSFAETGSADSPFCSYTVYTFDDTKALIIARIPKYKKEKLYLSRDVNYTPTNKDEKNNVVYTLNRVFFDRIQGKCFDFKDITRAFHYCKVYLNTTNTSLSM